MSKVHSLIRRAFAAGALALGAAACVATPSDGGADAAIQKIAAGLGARFVDGVNADDPAARARVTREIVSAPSLAGDGEGKFADLLARLRERYGTLALHHAEAVGAGEGPDARIALHVYARATTDGGWKDFQFWLDTAPPHRIKNIVFIADVAEPVYLPNGDLTSPETLDWLAGYVDKLAADNDLAGGLLVARGDRVVFERRFGHADVARRHPIGPATRFNLGSGGKMFTALAIAQLVEAGRLRFTDTLSALLPSVASQPFARTVTLAHLLSHTSGIGEFWTDDYERHWHELKTLDDFLPFVLKAGTSFAPGERFQYSNSNYILAGLVLEAVTGKPYDAVLADRLFGPLGMRDTGLFPFDDRDSVQAQRLGRGEDGRWRLAPHGRRGSSAGGALSTTADMLRFARALAAGRIVSPATLADMTTSKTAGLPDAPQPYGYGFILEGRGAGRSFGHGGIATGVNFELRYFPAADVTLIAFSNQDNGAYDDLRRNTVKLITGDR